MAGCGPGPRLLPSLHAARGRDRPAAARPPAGRRCARPSLRSACARRRRRTWLSSAALSLWTPRERGTTSRAWWGPARPLPLLSVGWWAARRICLCCCRPTGCCLAARQAALPPCLGRGRPRRYRKCIRLPSYHNAELTFRDAMRHAVRDQLTAFKLASSARGTKGQPVFVCDVCGKRMREEQSRVSHVEPTFGQVRSRCWPARGVAPHVHACWGARGSAAPRRRRAGIVPHSGDSCTKPLPAHLPHS